MDQYLVDHLLALLKIPSPAGRTEKTSEYIKAELKKLGLKCSVNNRGSIHTCIPGESKKGPIFIAHLDTLGAMVTRLKDNGRLEACEIGYLSARMVEGARVTIFSEKKEFRGTILPVKTSNHIYDHNGVNQQISGWDNLEIRIDEKVFSKQDIIKTGIDVGDIVAIDSAAEILESGFVASRFLDNMGGTAVLLSVIRDILSSKKKPKNTVYFLFTTNEEVDGSGSTSIPEDVTEAIAVDIAPVGEGQASSEFACTIAMKDYEIVYDRDVIAEFVDLAKKKKINFRKDVFKNLSTDIHKTLMAGYNVKVGYLGFGTDSTHAYERTHLDSLMNLKKLIIAYATR